jgi:hypothetical protein
MSVVGGIGSKIWETFVSAKRAICNFFAACRLRPSKENPQISSVANEGPTITPQLKLQNLASGQVSGNIAAATTQLIEEFKSNPNSIGAFVEADNKKNKIAEGGQDDSLLTKIMNASDSEKDAFITFLADNKEVASTIGRMRPDLRDRIESDVRVKLNSSEYIWR